MRRRLIVGGALQVTGVTATVCPLLLDPSVLYGRPLYVVMMHTSIVNTRHEIDSCANEAVTQRTNDCFISTHTLVCNCVES